MAFKSKAAAVMSSPNVIPMADVMLVLLIIFMVIMPMIVNGRPVNMAKAVNPENMPNAEKDDAVIVAVARDGRYYLSPGNREVALGDISGDVKDLIADNADKTVFGFPREVWRRCESCG